MWALVTSDYIRKGASEGEAAGGGGLRGPGTGTGDTYLIDPVIIGRHSGEDHWFLVYIAAFTGTEAHDAMHLP